MDSALKYSFIVTGAIGAMLVFSGGWWPLLGTALILLGIFMAMAFGTDHDLQVYLFAALAVWALVLYSGPHGHYEADGPEPSCTAGSCWDD